MLMAELDQTSYCDGMSTGDGVVGAPWPSVRAPSATTSATILTNAIALCCVQRGRQNGVGPSCGRRNGNPQVGEGRSVTEIHPAAAAFSAGRSPNNGCSLTP